MPDAFVDWLELYAPKKATHDRAPVHEHFDFDDFCGFYDIEVLGDGPWYSPRNCPVKGDQHTKITDCAFYFDGEYLGWKDHAANCAGADMSIGQLIKFLNQQKGEPYRGPIWSERDEEEELDSSQFGDDLDHMEPAAASVHPFLKVFPNAALVPETAGTYSKELCYAGSGTGCQCGGEHKYNQSNLSAESRANLDAVLAEAEEHPEATGGAENGSIAIAPVPSSDEFAMPEDCMYGWVGEAARKLQTPLSMACRFRVSVPSCEVTKEASATSSVHMAPARSSSPCRTRSKRLLDDAWRYWSFTLLSTNSDCISLTDHVASGRAWLTFSSTDRAGLCTPGWRCRRQR